MILEYRTIDLFGKLLFERVRIKGAFRKPNLMHNEACFLHIREGGYDSISESDLLSLDKGQSVLMKCGNFLSRMIPDKETGTYEAVAVHFHPDVLRRIYASELPSFLRNKKSPPSSSMALVQASVPINKYIEDVLFYFEHPQLVNEEILVLKTREIILLLMQTSHAPNVLLILEHLFTGRTVDFKKTVDAHLHSDLTLPEFAQLTNMSLSTFKRRFKEIYQTSPGTYLQQKRLEKSRDLLAVSDRSVTDIAFECGFKSPSHFSRKFRETYGHSPSEFRLNLSGK